MTKIKLFILTAFMAIVPLFAVALSPSVSAQVDIQKGVCGGATLNADAIGNGADCASVDSSEGGGISGIVELIINIFTWVVGVISVIMVIYGGYQYITSAGGDGVQKGKNTIMYALIGLAVAILAQVIVGYIAEQAASV